MWGAFAVLGLIIGLTACAGATPPLTAEQVTRQLTEHVATSTLTTVYTAETDPNKLLGRPGGYSSKTAFADSRIEPGLFGAAQDSVNGGGSVEVFADEDAATARRDYLQEMGKRLPILTGYNYQSGPVLVRVSRDLTPQQAAEYESALAAVTSPDNAPAATTPALAAPLLPTVEVPRPTLAAPRTDPATVSVASVHDAATVLLTDGTRLRQVGISSPTADSCQAKQATATTDAEVRRAPLTYQLLGQSDLYGNQWAYLQVGSADLGEKLARLGWVWAYPDSPAPQSYNQRVATQVDVARASKVGLFGSTCPESAVPAPAQSQSISPIRTIDDGTHVVGVDIEPGTYRTTGASEDSIGKMCSWSRRKDTSGEAGSVIAINIAKGPTTVTIKPSDGAFESRGCNAWTKLN